MLYKERFEGANLTLYLELGGQNDAVVNHKMLDTFSILAFSFLSVLLRVA